MRERRVPVQVRMLWNCWGHWEGLATFVLWGGVHPGVCLQPGGVVGAPLSFSAV